MAFENAESASTFESTVRSATLLSAVEMGLGSFLHAFYIPFAGHFLSLNQGFLLTRLVREAPPTTAVTVSNIAAVMKSLSPAGKRLTPMLALSAQGLCFTAGVAGLGANLLGVSVGMCLLSLWGFVQPFLISFLVFGHSLIEALLYLSSSLHKNLGWDPRQQYWAIGIVVSLKMIIGICVGILGLTLHSSRVERYFERMLRWKPAPRLARRGPVRMAFSELFSPVFFLSLAVTLFFFFSVESSHVALFWMCLRPFAVGFLLFLLVRIFPWERWVHEESQGRLSHFFRSVRAAWAGLKEI